MIAWRQLAAAWHAFWFAPASPLPMAVFRILFGLLVLGNGLLLAPDWLILFGENGIISAETARTSLGTGPRVNLFAWLPAGDGWTFLVFGAYMGAGLALTLGLFTRSSAAVLLACILSLHARNPYILNSADVIMRIAAFILIFSPAGAALSLDRRLRVARGEVTGPLAPVAPWAQRLLQVQIATVYLATALVKSDGATWVDGTAIYYGLHVEGMARFPVPFLPDHLWAIQLATWATLALEFALGTLVWVRELRYPLLALGVLLHAGIGWAFTIPLFGLLMVFTYVVFVDADDLARGLAWARAAAGRRIAMRARRIG